MDDGVVAAARTGQVYRGGPATLVEIDDTDTIFTHLCDPRTEGYVTGRFG